MAAPSINSYIGIPYIDRHKGDRTGGNCYGMIQLFYKEQFGIILPTYSDQRSNDQLWIEARIAEQIADCWIEVPSPMFGDMILHRESGRAHVGIIIAQGDLFLHTREGKDVTTEHYNSPFWKGCLVGFYRHKDRF